MTAWAILAIEFADRTPCPHAGQFLRSADFAHSNGRGFMDFTPDIQKAMRFESMAAALTFYKTVPNEFPLRPDGRPNRPSLP